MPTLMSHEPATLRIYFNVVDGWVWELVSGQDVIDAGFGFDEKDARSWGEYALAQYSK